MSESDSQYAVMNYIHLPEKYYQHKAQVVVVQKDEVIYNKLTTVHAHIETNDSLVDITWEDDYDSIFYFSYNGKYQNTNIRFSNGKLIINAENREQRKIAITIY